MSRFLARALALADAPTPPSSPQRWGFGDFGDFGDRGKNENQKTKAPLTAPPGRQLTPPWSGLHLTPQPGDWCACCGRFERSGGRWWRDAEPPFGWRCWPCHPPDGKPPHAFVEVNT